jgi:hypothetical protein
MFFARMHSRVRVPQKSKKANGDIMHFDVRSALGNLLLTAFLGVVGLFILGIAGLKKQSDKAATADRALAPRFNAQELWTSLGIAMTDGDCRRAHRNPERRLPQQRSGNARDSWRGILLPIN